MVEKIIVNLKLSQKELFSDSGCARTGPSCSPYPIIMLQYVTLPMSTEKNRWSTCPPITITINLPGAFVRALRPLKGGKEGE